MNTERPDNDDDARAVGGDGTSDAPEAQEPGSADAGASGPAESEASTGAADPKVTAEEETAEPEAVSEPEAASDQETAAEASEARGENEARGQDEARDPAALESGKDDAPAGAEETDAAEAEDEADAGQPDAERPGPAPEREVATRSTGVDESRPDPAPEADPAPHNDIPRDDEDLIRHGGARHRTPAIPRRSHSTGTRSRQEARETASRPVSPTRTAPPTGSRAPSRTAPARHRCTGRGARSPRRT